MKIHKKGCWEIRLAPTTSDSAVPRDTSARHVGCSIQVQVLYFQSMCTSVRLHLLHHFLSFLKHVIVDITLSVAFWQMYYGILFGFRSAHLNVLCNASEVNLWAKELYSAVQQLKHNVMSACCDTHVEVILAVQTFVFSSILLKKQLWYQLWRKLK